MRKKILISVIILVILSSIVIYVLANKEKNKNIPLTENVNVVPTMLDTIDGDSSWCATFQLIWNDMKNEVVKKDIVFNPQEKIVENLNKEDFNESMISDDYYFKIYGHKTKKLKEEIEKGIKEKFNQKSDILDKFSWRDEDLNNEDIQRYFFYTMLYREFEYKTKFNLLEKSDFGKYKDIKYFGLTNKSTNKQREQLEVLFYNSEEDFAIKIHTKSNDEVIFYKNPVGKSFNEIYKNLVNNTNSYNGNRNFEETDKFKAPLIDLNVEREYSELENKVFQTATEDEAVIEKAVQTIKFSLDEMGGKIKSEAAMDYKNIALLPTDTRKFNVDDTFVLFIKESSKEKPYFALKVNDITKYQS